MSERHGLNRKESHTKRAKQLESERKLDQKYRKQKSRCRMSQEQLLLENRKRLTRQITESMKRTQRQQDCRHKAAKHLKIDLDIKMSNIDNTIEVIRQRVLHEYLKVRFEHRKNGLLSETCKSCNRILFPDQVYKLKSQNLKTIVLGIGKENVLCYTCKMMLSKCKMPPRCSQNNLQTDPIPFALSTLSILERRYICRIQTYMTLIKLKPGDQFAQTGLAIHFPSNPSEVIRILPRQHKDIGVVCISGKYENFVRPSAIFAALLWLKRNNKLYRTIKIDWNVLSHSEKEIENILDLTEIGIIPVDYDFPNISVSEFSKQYAKVRLPRSLGPPVSFHDTAHAEALAFPWLFPRGRFYFDTKRQVTLSLLQYLQSRLLNRDPRFRLDIPYLVNCVNVYEKRVLGQLVSHWIRVRKENKESEAGLDLLTVKDIRNLTRNPDLTKNSFMFAKQLRGTAAFWKNELFSLLAKMRCLGAPDVFTTYSVDDIHWPELKENLKLDLGTEFKNMIDGVKRDPVVTAIYAEKRFKALIDDICKTKALGTVTDYHGRVEFQNRGTVHFHLFFWISDAPSIAKGSSHAELVQYIDKVILTQLPSEEDEDFYNLVKSRQSHNHTQKCQTKTGRCKYFFPRKQCGQTRILYECNRIRGKGTFYETKRNAGDELINPYNIHILKKWRANMDIQLVNGKEGLAYYVCKYVMKAEPTQLTDELAKAFHAMDMDGRLTEKGRMMRLGMILLKRRQMSTQEAAFRICHLPFVYSSRTVIKITTLLPEKRMRKLKKPSDIAEMSDECVDIFEDSILDVYRKRPNSQEFKKMCYYKFAQWYVKCPLGSNNMILTDKSACVRKKRHFACIRTSCISIHTNEYYYSLLLQFLPHREEFELVENYTNAKEAFLAKKHYLETNAGHSEKFFDEIIEAVARLRTTMALTELDEDDGVDDINELSEFSAIENTVDTHNLQVGIRADIDSDTFQAQQEVKWNSFKLNDMSENQLVKNIQSMSVDQKRVLRFIHKKLYETKEQIKIFLTGKAGTGKSFLIDTLVNWLRLSQSKFSGHDPVIVAAPTGIAAKNIKGRTLHSLLKLPVQRGKESDYSTKDTEPLPERTVKLIRTELKNKTFLIIDEVSMVGENMLININNRLCQILQSEAPFGGLHVLFSGDFLQLPPVKDRFCFKCPLFEMLTPIFLGKNLRQQSDSSWCKLLNRIALGDMNESDYKTLDSRKRTEEELDALVNIDLRLAATKAEVDDYNHTMQNEINSECTDLLAIDIFGVNDIASGHLADEDHVPKDDRDCGGLPKVLRISLGSKVMLIKNIGDGLVNGSMGTVHLLKTNSNHCVTVVYVKFDDSMSGVLLQDPNHEYSIPLERIKSEFLCNGRTINRYQFPLIPAWSVTIHKSQGLSLNKAIISVEKCFAPGQAYVAFSRVKSLEGVFIHGNICKTKNGGSIRVSDDAKEFLLGAKIRYKQEVKTYVKNYKVKSFCCL